MQIFIFQLKKKLFLVLYLSLKTKKAIITEPIISLAKHNSSQYLFIILNVSLCSVNNNHKLSSFWIIFLSEWWVNGCVKKQNCTFLLYIQTIIVYRKKKRETFVIKRLIDCIFCTYSLVHTLALQFKRRKKMKKMKLFFRFLFFHFQLLPVMLETSNDTKHKKSEKKLCERNKKTLS